MTCKRKTWKGKLEQTYKWVWLQLPDSSCLLGFWSIKLSSTHLQWIPWVFSENFLLKKNRLNNNRMCRLYWEHSRQWHWWFNDYVNLSEIFKNSSRKWDFLYWRYFSIKLGKNWGRNREGEKGRKEVKETRFILVFGQRAFCWLINHINQSHFILVCKVLIY